MIRDVSSITTSSLSLVACMEYVCAWGCVFQHYQAGAYFQLEIQPRPSCLHGVCMCPGLCVPTLSGRGLLPTGNYAFNILLHLHVHVVVLLPGFSTAKGGIVRSILFPKPLNLKFYVDSIKFIMILSIIGRHRLYG